MSLPPYPHFPTLTHGPVHLRAILPADLPALLEISYFQGQLAPDLATAADMLAQITALYHTGQLIHWGIEDQQQGHLVGTCGYYRGFEHSRGELGCILLPAFRNQGYMYHALQAAIQFGKEDMGLQHIFALTHPDNHRAIKLLQKLGMVPAPSTKPDMLEFILPATPPL